MSAENADPPAANDPGPGADSGFVLANLFLAGNLDRVEREAARFLENDPEDTEAHYYRGMALVDLKRYREAHRHLEFVLSREPESVRSHILAVYYFGARENWKLVRRQVEAGLRIDPGQVYFHRMAAIADLREMKLPQARKHIARARELDPEGADTANLYIRIHGAGESSVGTALWQLDGYREALRLDPHNAGLHASLGEVYLDDLDDPAEAEKCYREALRLEPANRDYQKGLFQAVAKRSLVYRLFSIPSRTFAWLRCLGIAIRYQPWRLIAFVILFKVVIAFFLWLLVATVLYWPGGKVYEWLLVSEIHRGSAASAGELRAWFWFRRWPFWARFALFLGINLGLWSGTFALLGIAQGTGFYWVGWIAGIHLAILSVLWGFRRAAASDARKRELRRQTPPPRPKRGNRPA